MKKIYLLFILLFAFTQANFGQLTISAVFDGPLGGGTPKGVELYVVSDIADLSIYGLGSANNGGGTDGEEFTFPAVSVTAGTYIYVASEAPQFTVFFEFAPTYTSGSMIINGDDAIELFKSGAVIDLFGDINTGGTGEDWDHLDGWAASNNGRAASSTFTSANWTFSGINALDGETTNATAAKPVPIGIHTPTPVELTSFTATTVDGGVVLNWTTATEVNNYGFEVEAEVAGNWTNVGFVDGHGNSNSPKDYSFFTSSNASSFRLKQIDTDGGFEYSDVVTVSGVLSKTELLQNHPNPFNPSTQISFALSNAGHVNISVYNMLGQKVSELVNVNMNAGTHKVEFNGSNFASGFYFYRLETQSFAQTMKMLLIK